MRAAVMLFASLLDEWQRRLFAGLKSLTSGRGGDRRIATLLGIDPSTVATGRRQLVEHEVKVDRVRRAGGGRRPTVARGALGGKTDVWGFGADSPSPSPVQRRCSTHPTSIHVSPRPDRPRRRRRSGLDHRRALP